VIFALIKKFAEKFPRTKIQPKTHTKFYISKKSDKNGKIPAYKDDPKSLMHFRNNFASFSAAREL